MRRKVVCVFGDFEEDDFVLEPPCSNDCNCEVCKDAFWVERVDSQDYDKENSQ